MDTESKTQSRPSDLKTVDLSGLAENWPSPFVRRKEVLKFSNGIICPETMANEASKGNSPKNAFRRGKDICYPVRDLVAWLEGRSRYSKINRPKNQEVSLPETGYLRLPEVLRLYPVSKSTWWAGVRDKKFPKPVKLSERTTAWRVEDIRELIQSVGEVS